MKHPRFKDFIMEDVSEEKSRFGKEGSVKYSDVGGHIIVNPHAEFSPRKHSVIDFHVQETHQGRGIGKKLLAHAMKKHDDLGAQASSTASVKVFHDAGFRNPEIPHGSFEEHENMRKQHSSVFMAHKDNTGKKWNE